MTFETLGITTTSIAVVDSSLPIIKYRAARWATSAHVLIPWSYMMLRNVPYYLLGTTWHTFICLPAPPSYCTWLVPRSVLTTTIDPPSVCYQGQYDASMRHINAWHSAMLLGRFQTSSRNYDIGAVARVQVIPV